MPSPNVQLYDTIDPSGSDEAAPLKETDVSVCVDWFAPAFAVGSLLATVIVAESLAVAPLLSVTVSVAV